VSKDTKKIKWILIDLETIILFTNVWVMLIVFGIVIGFTLLGIDTAVRKSFPEHFSKPTQTICCTANTNTSDISHKP
jgi:hypothetical protein